MHPWKPWILLATVAAFAGHAAVVYKWTDAAGVVHYSDQPEPGAEKIQTATDASKAAAAPARSTNPDAAAPNGEPATFVLGYAQFAVASPTPDQTFFGDEPITVNLAVSPALKQNHTLSWNLNGKELQDHANSGRFTLPTLERGTYVIAATVSDPETGESRSTENVTFFVRQPSLLAPQHQKP
jgi:hypothetical protein